MVIYRCSREVQKTFEKVSVCQNFITIIITELENMNENNSNN